MIRPTKKIVALGCLGLGMYLGLCIWTRTVLSQDADCWSQIELLAVEYNDWPDSGACARTPHETMDIFTIPWGPFKGRVFSRDITLYIS